MLGLGPDHVPRNMHAGRIKNVIFVKYDFQTDIRSIYFMLKVPYILHYVVILLYLLLSSKVVFSSHGAISL